LWCRLFALFKKGKVVTVEKTGFTGCYISSGFAGVTSTYFATRFRAISPVTLALIGSGAGSGTVTFADPTPFSAGIVCHCEHAK
jgi:hypothetical protein